MILDLILPICLTALVLVAALWVICCRDMTSAVIGFVVYGLFLGLVWVSLDSVDVALTEAAIGAGATGILLFSAATRLSQSQGPLKTPSVGFKGLIAILCALISLGLATLVLFPPHETASLSYAAAENLARTGLGNPVAAVLVAYRALDTLLETVVLLVALVAVWSLTPDHAWGGRPGPEDMPSPDPALRYLGQVLPPFGIVVAAYVFWVGADAPGGKFQSGTILGATWIITIMAGLLPPPRIDLLRLRILLVSGSLVFLAVGLAGFFVAGHFLAYPPGFEKPVILVVEAALTLSIAGALGMLVMGSPERPAR